MSARYRKSVVGYMDDLVCVPRTLDPQHLRRVVLTPSRRRSGTFRRRP